MSFLDPLIYGIRRLLKPDDSEMPLRPNVQFLNATLTDDPTNDRTLVSFTRGLGDADGTIRTVQTSDGAGNFVGAAGVEADTGYLGVAGTSGVDIPALGQFRAGYVAGGAILAKKDSTGADRRVISHGSGDPDATDFGDEDVPTHVRGQGVSFEVVGVLQLEIGIGSIMGHYPLLGDGTGPYGAHGSKTFDMVDADHGESASEHILVVDNTTPMTADRYLELPDCGALGADGAYTKFVQNDNGAGFSVRVTNASHGSYVAIADGKGAFVMITPTGARRMTADV